MLNISKISKTSKIFTIFTIINLKLIHMKNRRRKKITLMMEKRVIDAGAKTFLEKMMPDIEIVKIEPEPELESYYSITIKYLDPHNLYFIGRNYEIFKTNNKIF